MMNRFLTPLLLSGALAASVHASVLVELAGGYLKDSSGLRVQAGSGLLVLVASTDDDAFTPFRSDTQLVEGAPISADSDDVIVFVSAIGGDGNSNGTADAGEFRQAVGIDFGSDIPFGAPVQLYWFPSLSSSAQIAPAGTAYGAYRSGVADADGSEAWVLPADGTNGYELIFLTADAGSTVHAGTPGFGIANSSVEQGSAAAPASDRYTARLAALRKKLVAAKKIKDPERRARRVSAIRGRIGKFIRATKN